MDAIEKTVSFFSDLTKLILMWWYTILERIFRIFVPRTLKSLEGEIILLTGAGNGIGKMMAHELSNVGAQVLILWDVETDANEKTASELKSKQTSTIIVSQTVDITKNEDVKLMATKIRKEFGDVTVIFNNAGIVPVRRFLDTKPELMTKVFDVNLFSHFWILREFLPEMIKRNHGHIVTTASMVSFAPTPFCAPYVATKFGVYGFIESLKQELSQMSCPTKNVKFTSIYPIAVSTRALEGLNLLASFDPAKLKVTPFYIAEKAVEGFRQDYEHLYLPPSAQLITFLMQLLPTRVYNYLMFDILKCGVEITENYSLPGVGAGLEINGDTKNLSE